jgi:hypothetical protein
MASLTEIEPTFSSSNPVIFYDDDDAFSVEVDAAAVSGKARFVLGNAMRIFGVGMLFIPLLSLPVGREPG